MDFSLSGIASGLIGGLIPYVVNKFVDRFIATPKLRILGGDVSSIEPKMYFINGTRRGHATLTVNITNEDIFVAKGSRLYLTHLEMLDDAQSKFTLNTSIPIPWSLTQHGVAMPSGDDAVAIPSADLGKFDLAKGLMLTADLIWVSSNLEPIEEYRREIYRRIRDDEDSFVDDLTTYNPKLYDRSCSVHMPVRFVYGYPLECDRSYRIKFVATADNAEPYYFEVDVSFEEVQGIYHLKLANRVAGRHLGVVNRVKSFTSSIEAWWSKHYQKFQDDRKHGRI